MKTKFTTEQMEKAMQAKTVEELIELAKDFGAELTQAEATAYFAQLNPTSEVLSDAELERVSSGCDYKDPPWME